MKFGMSGEALKREIEAMASLAGIVGCALVEMEGGLPWCSAGGDDTVPMAEAATDYWRLTLRHHHLFARLGDLTVQVLIHSCGRITTVACPKQLLLVTISAEPDKVDWTRWKEGVGRLHAAVRAT
ncbi:MAG TPA: hypothetical protein VFE82_05255 [Ramlibacter sp.]|jgi:hypothetical protein|uniref:hypothetical protein n=1 Tax=Ramlibacter sp. TaxID=1917967 RepID=UPI002D40D3A7|nr:hypothetical protein [Ramlibacter sp.]HZY17867.1 hypothetical protein [Ramlibacter sp.]